MRNGKSIVCLHPLKQGMLCAAEFIKRFGYKDLGVEKKLFKKNTKNYCGVKKRVLYLHPLSKETSWATRKTVHLSFPLGKMSDRTDGEEQVHRHIGLTA